MPWSNQSGGDNNQGASPWGSRQSSNHSEHRSQRKRFSGGDRGSGSMPPDVDEILRKGQDHFKKFGGGGLIFLGCVMAAVVWMFQCFYIVQQNEQAVELRFGQPKNIIVMEGLHFCFWPIETYRKVSRTEQTVTIGTREQDALMLSGDQNIVNVNFSVYYYIVEPSAYLFNVNDQSGTIQQVAESAMREVVGRRPADDVYRDQREAVATEVSAITQSTLNKYGVGVNITRVSITEAAPPSEVAEAFNSVQQAEQERNRAIEQGNQHRAQKRGIANGQASQIREAAAAYKARIVEEARGEAQRFATVEKEAKEAPDVTRFRLYLEAVEQMLSSPGKLVFDQAHSGIVPYFSLNEIMRNNRNISSGPDGSTNTGFSATVSNGGSS
ncbi:MAG: membrane protease subunit HflK [Candidatus Tokpelaia sp. JSC085]|nr:MAG: membrane protease subunit HflK [Candidatus Tokpelaia sp. JSC085]